MAETMARTTADGRVEMIEEGSVRIDSVPPMTPLDAAFLARGLLACTAALSSSNPPPAGAIGGDAHLPVTNWVFGPSFATGLPVLTFSVQPGIEVTFELTLQGAKELGRIMAAYQGSDPPPAHHSGSVH